MYFHKSKLNFLSNMHGHNYIYAYFTSILRGFARSQMLVDVSLIAILPSSTF